MTAARYLAIDAHREPMSALASDLLRSERPIMFKFVARRPWSLALLGLVILLASCKNGGSGGGGGY